MGRKLFEIALAGALAGGAGLFVLIEESAPTRQLSHQWAREGGVADWASRLVAEALAGPAAELAPQAGTPTVLSHPRAATWMVVGNIAIPEPGGSLRRHTYRVMVGRLCDQVAERACWRIDELELDGGPVAVEAAAPPAAVTRAGPQTQPAASPPMKPAPADEVMLTVAALTALGSAALKPAPDSVGAPPAGAAAEPAASDAARDGEARGAAGSNSDASPRAALPSGEVVAMIDAAADGAASTEEEPLYTWADPAVLIPIQQQLTARGFDIGIIDGILGPRTREAIKSYQSQHGLPVDGEASAALLQHMGGRTAAVATETGASAMVGRIQRRLQRLGYVVDTPYGTMGWHTREAISTYQWRHGLEVDGKPSTALLTHLEQQGGG